ncbi:MAG TPA: phasin family protein [Salinarimonas sp.]|jgi:hypothetical protein|nr:phasin family protein [Salinarimonas sp.]
MSKKTVQFKLHAAGEAPPEAAPVPTEASPEAWIGAAPGEGAAVEPSAAPGGGVGEAMSELARGMGEAFRAGIELDRGPAAEAMERVLRARTPSELAAAQADLARAGIEQGLQGISRASRVWADAVARAASRMGRGS